MIVSRFRLRNYGDWEVMFFVAVTQYYADEILDCLEDIDCPIEELRRAERNLRSGMLDTGLTYSNYDQRRTVMVIALTSSTAEFFNSLLHEAADHLQKDIIKAFHINPFGEDAAYCLGEIGREIFPIVQPMLCEHCRASVHKRIQKNAKA